MRSLALVASRTSAPAEIAPNPAGGAVADRLDTDGARSFSLPGWQRQRKSRSTLMAGQTQRAPAHARCPMVTPEEIVLGCDAELVDLGDAPSRSPSCLRLALLMCNINSNHARLGGHSCSTRRAPAGARGTQADIAHVSKPVESHGARQRLRLGWHRRRIPRLLELRRRSAGCR